MRLLITALSLFWAFLLFMTGARFLILLFNVDRTGQVGSWIMRHSDFWVKPFFSLFHLANKGVETTGGFFEPASAIAFIVYLAVGALIIKLVRSALTSGFGRRGYYRSA